MGRCAFYHPGAIRDAGRVITIRGLSLTAWGRLPAGGEPAKQRQNVGREWACVWPIKLCNVALLCRNLWLQRRITRCTIGDANTRRERASLLRFLNAENVTKPLPRELSGSIPEPLDKAGMCIEFAAMPLCEAEEYRDEIICCNAFAVCRKVVRY